MRLIKNCCAFIFLLTFAMTALAEEAESKTEFYKLSCAVYDRVGEKITIAGSLIVSRVNTKPVTEAVLTFATNSKQLLSVTDEKVVLTEEGSFNIDANLPDPETRQSSRLSYDFYQRQGGSYVVITMTSCLQCVALRHSILGTGLCSLH